MSVCLNHTGREATTKCATCFKPMCEECAKPSGDQVFCSETCIQNYIASADRIADIAVRDKARARKKLIKRIITLIILAGIGAGAYYFLKNDPAVAERLKREAQSLQEKVEKGTKEISDKVKEN